MQYDRELQRMRMEEQRLRIELNGQQLMDIMVGDLGIFARNTQDGSNCESGSVTNSDSNTNNS
jgi:hypothetical protein